MSGEPRGIRAKLPEHAHPLVRQFFGLLNVALINRGHVAAKAGLSTHTICAWRRAAPQLPNFEAALNVLGYRLAIVPLEKRDVV